MTIFRALLLGGSLLATPTLALADDQAPAMPDGIFSVYGGYSMAHIQSDELVYGGGQKLSELNWESKYVSIFTVGLSADVDKSWTVKGDVDIGTGGDGHMVDYDWLYGPDAWSERSIHPDTRLDHYFSADIQVSREVYKDMQSTLSLGAGFNYSDVKWTAYGGSYVYSTFDFRDTVGNFPDGEKGISYRQKVPVGYLTINGEHKIGQWTLGGSLRGGMSFGIEDIDDHWMRNARFYDSMEIAPMLGATITADYAINDRASLYFSGSFDRVFRADGDMRMTDTTGATPDASYDDAAGASFQAMSIGFGLKGTF